MSDWLDKPAGKHGFLTIAHDRLVFQNGTPIKFWGVNISMDWAYVKEQEANQWTAYLARYGVNAVRFHKHTAYGLQDMEGSTVINPQKQQHHDYFTHQLSKAGIYYGCSHIYGHRPRPGDRERLLAYDEIVAAGSGHLKGSTIGLVNFAPDLQDLSIELTVNMLNHVNPHTGSAYAHDPALAFIELQNEDNIFFPTTHNFVMATPTYKKLFCRLFSEWLKERYGSHEGLVKAWGAKALNCWPDFQQGEHLDLQNIYPLGHHGYYNKASMQNPDLSKRLADTAFFLYETQNRFYERYVRAIRDTGYKGVIVASCWQAGDYITHYLNLHSDATFGMIDRHNYFGGGQGGHELVPGKVNAKSMLTEPGSGLLSTGMQQVEGLPFSISEWMSNAPNEWTVEAAPLIAVYGMGLQGWDASFSYGSNQPSLTDVVEAPRHGVYNSDAPFHMGLYPALATMVYRGDVQEGAVVARRSVHVPGLYENMPEFEETVKQIGDQKNFTGHIPLASLAAGRVLLAFEESEASMEKSDLSTFWHQETQTIRSNTGQLTWNYQGQGYFTVNTPGTKALVGFSENQLYQLGTITLQTSNPFVVVFLTSLSKDQNLENADRWLLTVMARTRNTHMAYSADGETLLEKGTPPLRFEPVQLTLGWQRKDKPTVYVLDHEGYRTGQTIPAKKQNLPLCTGTYQTMYYEISFARKQER
jgi:hypothetical protein